MRKAEAGSAVAQSILGVRYLHGIDMPVDLEQAFRLLTLASKRAPRAQANLAEMYRRGLATEVNLEEAFRLYKSAAKKGEFMAQIELARMYSSGGEIERDDAMARQWYASAMEQVASVGDCPEIDEAKAFLDKLGPVAF
jgi:TPR repeat protein